MAMRVQFLRRLSRLVGAVVLVAVLSVILDAAQPVLGIAVIVLVYVLAVGAIALWLGWPAALAATLAAAAAINLLFMPPRLALVVVRVEDGLLLAAFLMVCGMSIPALGQAQSSLRDARARQRELTHLYELMAALAGQRRLNGIARTLAAHLQKALQAKSVEVVIQPDPKREMVVSVAPEGSVAESRPDLIVPLMTSRGLLGEVHIWPADDLGVHFLSDRLVRAAAGQAALAVERVLLVEAETRAQVLEESDRMKGILLSSVSHELRTPLATIKAAVSSLRSGAVGWDSAARDELLAAVEEETDHLNYLVGNLLDMSRIEAGALRPQRQWSVLADILRHTLRRLQRISAGHRFEIDVSEDLPLVPIDDAQIGQVFANLIGNSLKYTPVGSAIAIRARVIDNQNLVVTVANQGPHVAEADLPRIFDKFHRVTAAHHTIGAGLGLSICKGIVEAHGGRIWAENLPPSDPYTFAVHFTLPLTFEGARPPRLPEGIS
ncbi:MAG: ATP-binding protein [Anaerolineae bacterium]|nr:ATP-binding protein [Thermoflexales bacterium]MDW8406547.1 ATP-binding protein [Anaerolineae bacterium]